MSRKRFRPLLPTLAGLGFGIFSAAAIVSAASEPSDEFHPHDVRVFKTAACTQDHKAVEALYYIAASRSDMATGKASPSSQLMKEEVDGNWRAIASRLTSEQVMEERAAGAYHAALSEMIPQLERAVEAKSGVSISVSEVNTRPMDSAKDKEVPNCGPK